MVDCRCLINSYSGLIERPSMAIKKAHIKAARVEMLLSPLQASGTTIGLLNNAEALASAFD
jgi:hypothetical protein